MFMLTVVDDKPRELFASVVDLGTGHVFDFGKNAFAPSPKSEDSFIRLLPVTAETHKSVKVLYTELGPDPANAARYAVFFHESVGGPPVLQPFAVSALNQAGRTLLVSASVSR